MSTADSPISFSHRTVGDIAATVPGATTVFRRYRLDFCCGGDKPLSEAADSRGVEVDTICRELGNLASDSTVSYPQETDALINYIVEHYHSKHRRELPELLRLALKVETVHQNHPAAPQELFNVLDAISQRLDAHMQREEEQLFPLMRQGGDHTDSQLLDDLEHDHNEHGEDLRRIETITNGFRPPQDACRTWQALYTGVARFVDDVMEHVHLENNVLFPRFK